MFEIYNTLYFPKHAVVNKYLCNLMVYYLPFILGLSFLLKTLHELLMISLKNIFMFPWKHHQYVLVAVSRTCDARYRKNLNI